MDEFAKIIYDKFFMRDVLGKLGPGAVVVIYIFSDAGGQSFDFLVPKKIEGGITYIIALPIFYLVGLDYGDSVLNPQPSAVSGRACVAGSAGPSALPSRRAKPGRQPV